MGTPFLSEIRIMSFNFPPKGWAFCNGQTLPINQNQALFSLMGTTYGGNGQTTFQLPNLQGRVPIHMDSQHTLGETGGEQAHTVTQAELPTHTHVVNAVPADGSQIIPGSAMLAKAAPANPYQDPANLGAMNPASVGTTGGSQPHQNMQPYLVLSFCIALQGIFPSRN
jgi:microcystin-dependent protein